MMRSKNFLIGTLTLAMVLPAIGCAWISHTNSVPALTVSDPSYNAADPLSVAFNDKAFGTKIVRVSGNSGDNILLSGTTNSGEKWPNRICHQYSSNDNAWNADGSLLLLHGCDNRFGILLDGNTFKVLKVRNGLGGFWVWDRNDPDKAYVFSGDTVKEVFPQENRSNTIMTLSGYSGLTMAGHGQNASDDGRWVAVTAKKRGQPVMFGIDLANRRKGPDIPAPSDLNRNRNVLISASGKYLIAIRGGLDMDQDVYDVRSGEILNRYRGPINTKHPDTYQHNGRDYWIFIASGNGAGGQVWRRDLLTNEEYAHMDFGVGNHVSTRNVKDGRFAIVSYDSSRSPFPHEIMAVRIDGDRRNEFRRLFKHNSVLSGRYTNESHPNPSPDGKKIVFASNWGSGSADAYVALLPDWDTPADGGTTGGGPVTDLCNNLYQSGQTPPRVTVPRRRRSADVGSAWKTDSLLKCAPGTGQIGELGNRSHSVAFKRQVVEEFLAGENPASSGDAA